MSDPEVKYLGDVQRLELKRGDIIVLTLAGRATAEVVTRIGENLVNRFPGHEILILDDGVKIGVIGEASTAE